MLVILQSPSASFGEALWVANVENSVSSSTLGTECSAKANAGIVQQKAT